ncbi:uncharacterized protein BX664DRAFT_257131 [Halteromyces radiatus]|uniref:uncharacterized protein n=1 Tax=Halteromyces radiatus TaxID=101107 RepID=UPI00221FEDCD|nr:uncharacterized protein BX664DRAFT_257131 [Halteromyces radiatus]KAI8096898.1 hypothetical protein BX664DRAFT_257131 [Halteromyces radiatus]
MQKNVAPFLNKVYNMVNDPSSDDLIRWSADGKSFFVVRHEDFARSVLPRFFKHSNFSSFVRQLNMYGFHKVPHLQHGVLHSDNDSEQWEFSNPHFQRNQPDLLLLVTRKKGRETDEKEQLTTTNNIDLHHILEEIQVIKQHQMNISSQLKNIQNDNSVLWQETISARERHQRHQETIDKILRFLASVFSNDKSMAIPRKRRFLLEAPDSDNKAQQDIGYQSYGSSTGEENDCGRPTKVNKTGTTPEFKLEDYVSGLQGYTGIPSSSTTLPASLSQTKPSTNPTSELADAIALNDKSKQSSSTPDTILTSVPQQSTTPTNTTPAPIITPSRNTPSLPQVSNNIESLAKTADDINSDIDTLGSNIEALAQQLGFDPTKSNDDLLGYVDMDKFLQAYGKEKR